MAVGDARWWQRLSSPLRRFRWSISRWSSGGDRAFHDDLFRAQDYDSFSPSYPGYLTIRRFADHAERHFDAVRTVVDLGCGPGEITCELARRRPGVTFLGVDHSDVAIARARTHAARLGLTNVTFESGDIERFTPAGRVDLVVMFDAFHHALDANALVSRLQRSCDRFFLIEPAGTWLGQWDHRTDLDWVSIAIREIRERLEYQFGLDVRAPPKKDETAPVGKRAAPDSSAAGAKDTAGEPTEHRHTLADFEEFFRGFVLDVRGTIAGLEWYGPHAHERSPLSDTFGDLAYDLVVRLEDVLFDHGLDLAAKHWAICATRSDGDQPTMKRPLRRPTGRQPSSPVLSAYGAEYESYTGPRRVGVGERFEAEIRVRNTGWRPWSSVDAQPVMLSYHWLDTEGRTITRDGLRTPLPTVVLPGQSVTAVLHLQAPFTAGEITLAVDLVHEGIAWFSDEGVQPLREPMLVRDSLS